MSEEKSGGIWFIIIIFTAAAVALIIAGIIGLASPMTIIGIARGMGIAGIINSLPIIGNMFGIDPISSQPLLGMLPALAVLVIIVAIVVLIDVYGLWTNQSWAWILTVLISIAMIPFVIGIIYLWILFKEDTKMAYGQL
ncbi:MAG: hypothetical protein ACFFDN_29425 [Candidatus Hodarchaeota archaeon]